ncbi:prepilin-type N-terminal cleavage/methylation domain-containing protein [Roseiconus nitratireducens]|uniref:prepilin-type N-terminal cleavage/methylation domain-containing protein n=1 Tax=Roseiconus nitratireducens TaxID=2605748 RepID=UPI0013759A41|nr:prepilin-type N-terminal cleavage/methylation domain-containing protein [Roseiconus nitratireducens]
MLHHERRRSTTRKQVLTVASRIASRRRGFSLIELVVVLVLMALLATLAAYSVRGVFQRQRLARGVEIIQQFDLALRRAARRQRSPISAQIDPAGRRILILEGSSRSREFSMPRRVRIDRLRLAGATGSAAADRIRVDGQGASPSYALRLASGAASRWVLVAGGTGQLVSVPKTSAVVQLLETR